MFYVDNQTLKMQTPDGKRLVKVQMYSDGTDAVANFPLTGDGIDGLDANVVIAPGSTIYVTNPPGLYMMSPAMKWDKQ